MPDEFPVVGFTGTKDGLTAMQLTVLEALFRRIPGARELHHGDCVGADDAAHQLARKLGWRIVVHPPIKTDRACGHQGDERREPKDFGDRNEDIVRECDILVACPKLPEDLAPRSGTWQAVRQGRRYRRPIGKIRPDGVESWERPDRRAA